MSLCRWRFKSVNDLADSMSASTDIGDVCSFGLECAITSLMKVRSLAASTFGTTKVVRLGDLRASSRSARGEA